MEMHLFPSFLACQHDQNFWTIFIRILVQEGTSHFQITITDVEDNGKLVSPSVFEKGFPISSSMHLVPSSDGNRRLFELRPGRPEDSQTRRMVQLA